MIIAATVNNKDKRTLFRMRNSFQGYSTQDSAKFDEPTMEKMA
jgi:hypothetical protein